MPVPLRPEQEEVLGCPSRLAASLYPVLAARPPCRRCFLQRRGYTCSWLRELSHRSKPDGLPLRRRIRLLPLLLGPAPRPPRLRTFASAPVVAWSRRTRPRLRRRPERRLRRATRRYCACCRRLRSRSTQRLSSVADHAQHCLGTCRRSSRNPLPREVRRRDRLRTTPLPHKPIRSAPRYRYNPTSNKRRGLQHNLRLQFPQPRPEGTSRLLSRSLVSR